MATLLTVPNSTSLVNLVLANDALLSARRQFLNKKCALLCQVVELTQKVLIVVLYFGFIAFVFAFFLIILNFFLVICRFLFVNILDVGRG